MGDERHLHVFEIGPDTVVASDLEDAWTVWCAHTGERREDYEPYELPLRLEDSATIKIWCDVDENICEPNDNAGKLIQRTCREWADRSGRGFLCSTEY